MLSYYIAQYTKSNGQLGQAAARSALLLVPRWCCYAVLPR